MATVNFYLDRPFIRKGKQNQYTPVKKVLNDRETSINIVLNVRKLIKVCTREKILAKHWDFRNRKAKPSMDGNLELNLRLDGIKNNVLKAFRDIIERNPSISFGELREMVRNVVNDTMPEIKSVNFQTGLAEFINQKKGFVKIATIEKYVTFKNTIAEFASKRTKYTKLGFHHIDMNFYSDFMQFLISGKEGQQS